MRSTPVTMISGFLGAGKTTILRELLSQSKYKIGCVVNDVSAINIDAKLVRNQSVKTGGSSAPTSTIDLAPTIELQNGCACCSIQDELFMSFEQILSVADRTKVAYDRIVLENSGVAEPQNIRDAFAEAEENGHPVIDRIHLSTLITVVDSHTFIKEYACRNPVATRPDLGGDQSMFRPVVDLLVEQIEVADYVVLNKVDLLGEEHLPELTEIIRSINPLCSVLTCSHGKANLDELFGPDAKALLAALNTEGQHRGYVAASKAKQAKVEKGHEHDHDHSHDHAHEKGHGHSHDHGHNHDHGHDHGHNHDHGHDHSHDHAHEKGHDHSHDHSHDHGHDHSHSHGHGQNHGHDHGHGHGHDHDHDHGHNHSHHHDPHHGHNHAPGEPCDHDHDHEHKKTTAETRFGITTFVYSRRRPFHPQRLRETVLKWMPVTHNKEVSPGAMTDNDSPIKTVMRSKGFAWLAHGHASAYYWSHAGQHFELRDEGDWWAAVEDEEWPTGPKQRAAILSDFEEKYGDRRQEIVFIGIGMDQPAIEAALDSCLLSDDEMGRYDANWAKVADPHHAEVPSAAAVPG